MSRQTLPVQITEPIETYPKGFYAVYSHVDMPKLDSLRVARQGSANRSWQVETLDGYLSFLHSQEGLLHRVPRPDRDFKPELKRCVRWIDAIGVHDATEAVTFDQLLTSLSSALDGRWTVTHSDLTIGNILVEGADGDTVEASANCLIHTYGKKGASTRGSLYDFTFCRIDGALKITRKKITFIDDRLEGPIDIYHL